MTKIVFPMILISASAMCSVPAAAQVSTSCSEAYNYCMRGSGSRTNNDANRGDQCKALRTKCMQTGEWNTRFQQLTKLRRE